VEVRAMNHPFGRGAAFRAALQMTGSTYVIYATGLLVSALIARSVGPDNFGHYSYLIWLTGVLILISNNGLTTSGIRFVSESLGRGSMDDARNVHGWLKRRQLACMAIVVALYLIALPFFQPSGWQTQHQWAFAAIVLVSMAAKAMYLFSISIAKGYGRFDIEALTSAVISILNAIAVVVMMVVGAPLMAYLQLFALTCVAYALSATWMLYRGGIRSQHGALDPVLLARLKQHLLWTVVLTIATAFTNKSIETWLLNALVGSAEVAYFTIAAGLTRGGLDLLSSGLTSVLMPSMAHAFGSSGHERVAVILSHSMRYFTFLGLMLAGVGVLWAKFAVVLMYGLQYTPVIPLLQIMVVVGGITLSEGAFGALLSTTDNQRLRAAFAGVAIIASAIAAFTLVPLYGLMGAVIAHAISRVLVFAITLIGIVRLLSLKLPWRELIRLTASSIIAAIVAGLLLYAHNRPWMGVIAGFVYIFVYTLSTVMLRAWTRGDADHLMSLLERMPLLEKHLGPRIARWANRLPEDF
jgi:O-antigen/teichoic acid export membrane protein